jgi:hypothetical protein
VHPAEREGKLCSEQLIFVFVKLVVACPWKWFSGSAAWKARSARSAS